MSSSLYWKPTEPEPPKHGGYKMPLKTILVQQYFDAEADGSLSYPEPVTIGSSEDIAFLQGESSSPIGSDAIVELHRALKKVVPGLVRPELDRRSAEGE